MAREGAHESLWIATAAARTREALRADLDVDVAVVGGGIVGLTSAYLLQKEGRRVALLERDRLLHGVTGHTTAKVTSQQGVLYQTLVERFGEEKARLHGEASETAKETIARLVAETGADARFTRAPNHVYTTDRAQVDRLRKEAEVSARLGLPASFTLDTELPFPVEGAVRFEDQAHFHPSRYLLRLAERAEAAGCQIFEQTPVVDLKDGEPCEVRTRHATLRARHVLVATNVPILDKAYFVTRMKAKRDYAVAAANEGRRIEGMYVNVDEPHRSVRPYEGDDGPMLVFAGDMHDVGERDSTDHYANMARFAREHFSIGPIQYRWSTQDYFPVDELAFIGKASPTAKRTFTSTGFRAWGMTQGTVAALLFTDWVLGRENPWTDLYDPYGAARVAQDVANKEFIKLQARATKNLVGERLMRHPERDLAPGEGQVMRVDGKVLAVSRDLDGTVRSVSAACSHMGCLVAWNSNERSWDCPCHGSRFGMDGRVLHGPAVAPLKEAEPPRRQGAGPAAEERRG